jgi:hypothetical protein
MQAVRKTKTNEICTATKIVLSQGKQQCFVCAQGKQQKYCIDMDHSLGSFTVFFVLGCASHCSQTPSPFHQQHLLPLQKDLLGWELPWNDVQMNASGFVLCKARDHSVMPLQTVQSHYYFVFCVLAQQRLRFLPAGPPDIQIAPVTAAYVPPGASRVPVLCHLLQLEPTV